MGMPREAYSEILRRQGRRSGGGGEVLRSRSEADEQAEVMQWLRLKYPDVPVFVSCQGMKVSAAAAMKLKRLGYQAGSPDFFIVAPRGKWHGFFCEMKRSKGGHTQDNQTAWLNKAEAQGYFTAVCAGADNAEFVIQKYMDLK